MMYHFIRRYCFVIFCLFPLSSFAAEYEAHMLISLDEQRWFTNLMQAEEPIDPDVYRGMPLGKIQGPTFENGVSVQFMVFKSESPDIYNILAAPTFKGSEAYGSGIDMDDREDFWLYNDLVFAAHGDLYRIILHPYS